MNRAYIVIAILAIALAAGLAVNLISESSAWHSKFSSKKDCVDFFKSGGNTNKEANFNCNKVIPH